MPVGQSWAPWATGSQFWRRGWNPALLASHHLCLLTSPASLPLPPTSPKIHNPYVSATVKWRMFPTSTSLFHVFGLLFALYRMAESYPHTGPHSKSPSLWTLPLRSRQSWFFLLQNVHSTRRRGLLLVTAHYMVNCSYVGPLDLSVTLLKQGQLFACLFCKPLAKHSKKRCRIDGWEGNKVYQWKP